MSSALSSLLTDAMRTTTDRTLPNPSPGRSRRNVSGQLEQSGVCQGLPLVVPMTISPDAVDAVGVVNAQIRHPISTSSSAGVTCACKNRVTRRPASRYKSPSGAAHRAVGCSGPSTLHRLAVDVHLVRGDETFPRSVGVTMALVGTFASSSVDSRPDGNARVSG
jgi:hypothetical protein